MIFFNREVIFFFQSIKEFCMNNELFRQILLNSAVGVHCLITNYRKSRIKFYFQNFKVCGISSNTSLKGGRLVIHTFYEKKKLSSNIHWS